MEEQMEILPDNKLDINLPVVYVKQLKLWSNSETKKLVSLYKSLLPEIGNRLTYKKQMWDEISTHFADRTPQQCESRLSTMFRRKKLAGSSGKVLTTETDKNNDFELEPEQYRIRKNIQLWSNSETKLLADLYKKFIGDVGSDKRFPQKKDMWSKISTHFTNKNAKQCESRFMRLVNTKQAGIVTYVRYKSLGTRRKKMKVSTSMPIRRPTMPIKEELQIDDVMEEQSDPLDTQAEEKEEFEEIKDDEALVQTEFNDDYNAASVQKEKSIQQTLLEIAARKEETKERRHREKLEAFRQMQNILQQLLDRKNNPAKSYMTKMLFNQRCK